ncbi:T9SS type A sorting domain-containing protein [Aurantibacter crassamenti]|uniref:T9SS type A sorting domain-containing protein n=1 Tax=Aurantibacter crassamenti TaxID=1837375 RepID=UPI001939E948|nr:T9SS type A sorting domain-containing protein [Aurantibacter crassamenti]MBM1104787.1 T9SS type A sorting domain-containing protein [Aurantibacter crassamenti]
MKLFYTVLLLGFSMATSAQEIVPLQPKISNEIADFKLYPNPAFDNVVYITTKHNAPKTVVIYDIFGEVLLKSRIQNKALSIAHLTAGVYVMKVTERNKTITRKLVVK